MPCSGDLGTRWSTTYNDCVGGTSNQICDPVNRTTCYVGRTLEPEEPVLNLAQLIEGGYLPTAEIKWDPQPGQAGALVEYVGAEWSENGLRGGDRVISIGNNLVTEALLAGLHLEQNDIDVMVARGTVVYSLTLCGVE